jgi:hypothetical protein
VGERYLCFRFIEIGIKAKTSIKLVDPSYGHTIKYILKRIEKRSYGINRSYKTRQRLPLGGK